GVEELLSEQRERLLDVVVEDLEVERHVLVAGVGVVLAAEIARAPVERRLVVPARALEEHVLRHVRDSRMLAVEARAGLDGPRDRGRRGGGRVGEHRAGSGRDMGGLAEEAREGRAVAVTRRARTARRSVPTSASRTALPSAARASRLVVPSRGTTPTRSCASAARPGWPGGRRTGAGPRRRRGRCRPRPA